MSWSVTFDSLDDLENLPDEVTAKLAEDNEAYSSDAVLAFTLAKDAGLTKVTLSGGRTPSPYGGPDCVVVSVLGFTDNREAHAVPKPFFDEVRANIFEGPDDDEPWDYGWGKDE